MKKTNLEPPEYPFSISHANRLFFIGSCFSDHMSSKTSAVGIPTFSQPLGIIFNPHSIADFFNYCINKRSLDDTILTRKDVFLSWIANSEIHAYEKAKLSKKLYKLRENTLAQIKNCDFLFITFGTAWVYRFLAENKIVANCHKLSAKDFKKELLETDRIVKQWEETIEQMQKLNPNLKIIFTVSPVRHYKDGLSANFLSKSILRTSIHQLQQKFEHCYYFPAYEKVIDELRDYSYFEKDGLHPNSIATNEIWHLFKTTLITPASQKIIDEYVKLKTSLHHKPLHPQSEESMSFQKKTKEEIKAFQKKYASIAFNW